MPRRERRSIRVSLFYLVVIFGIALRLVFMGISTVNELVSTKANVRQTLVLESNRTQTKVDDYFGKHRDILLFLSADQDFHSLRMPEDARGRLVSVLRDAQDGLQSYPLLLWPPGERGNPQLRRALRASTRVRAPGTRRPSRSGLWP